MGYNDIKQLKEQIKELEKKCDKLGTDLYNAENIVSYVTQQLSEKDGEIERLKQDYDEVWEDAYFRVREDFELDNHCGECRRYYIEELNKQLIEQLEKVKETLYPELRFDYSLYLRVMHTIDNQIKELKEGK